MDALKGVVYEEEFCKEGQGPFQRMDVFEREGEVTSKEDSSII